jgi:hypothetical protein
MRLWSIHPEYLDAKGLVALWREALLAQNVLLGNTKGYKKHPQLNRFKNTGNPIGAIARYLRSIVDEADRRGYNFNKSKIANKKTKNRIPVTNGQVEYEFKHLLEKLHKRDPDLYNQFKMVNEIKVNPIFIMVSGNVEDWEKI